MDHVRMPHAPLVPVPAPLPSPPAASAEERRRLRVARHQAFQRVQQNAAWARALLVDASAASAASGGAVHSRLAGLSAAELRTRLAESEDALAAARTAVDRAAGRTWEDEEVDAMKRALDAADPAEAAEAAAAARARLAQRRIAAERRQPEIVRL